MSRPRGGPLLAVAALAVAFAAADTYVVVLALPDMMSGVGLPIDQLQRGAPIVSGFLLGYVAVLPLVGRIADLRGRVPVLTGSLVLFALGSLVTASSYDLPSLVAGRFLQGVGGGGLIPATLALVAELYPPARRGLPLGVVGAVQEVGSVLGPVYGALVLAVGGWRDIFWVNLAAGLLLAAAVTLSRARAPTEVHRPLDPLGAVLAAAATLALLLVMLEPESLATDVTLGLAFVPVAGGSRWLSPVALALFVLVVLLVLRCLLAAHPLLEVRRWCAVARATDLPGALALSLCLTGIIVAFATTDPEAHVLDASTLSWLAVSVCAAVLFVVRVRRARDPLLPRGALRRRSAWGALVISFLVGAALIAALVDVPVFARLTVYPDSQLGASLILVRLLVALPVGALLGGFLTRHVAPGWITAAGMALATVGLLLMARWDLDSLAHATATVPLVLAGVGFGLAIAPVNAALLAGTDAAVHGLTSALLVVARTIGMLVGISVLTTIGLSRYYSVQAALPSPAEICGTGGNCAAYTDLLKEAALSQLHTVFVGAAVCAILAGVTALLTLRPTSAPDPVAAEAVSRR